MHVGRECMAEKQVKGDHSILSTTDCVILDMVNNLKVTFIIGYKI